MVHIGRKMCGNARRLAKRENAPATRSVPTQTTPPTYEARGTANVAKMTMREREMIDAWDNTGTTGNTVVWNARTHCTALRMMARRSGMHVHDGLARHDVRVIEGNTVHPTVTRSAQEFVRQLHIERKYG